MTQSEFLKFAYLRGMGEAARDMDLSREDLDVLVKEGQGRLRQFWGGVKRLFGRGQKPPAGPAYGGRATRSGAAPVQTMEPGATVSPRSGASVEHLAPPQMAPTMPARPTAPGAPKAPAKKPPPEPAPRPAETAPAPTPTGEPSAAEVAAGRQAIAGKRMTPTQVAESAAREKQVLQEGAKGGLGFLPTGVAPVALGAGVGYAAGGEQGALTGAGIGLGARLGAGGLLRRAREMRGLSRLTGKAMPTTEQILESPVLRNALLGAGALGAGGGALGHLAGRMVPERQPEQWYGGLGLTPQTAGGLSQAAMPYLGRELGVSPEVLQSLGEQYGLVPPQMPAEMAYY